MSTLDAEYRLRESAWKRLEEEAVYILRAQLNLARVKTHSILSRTKTLESVHEKGVRKGIDSPLEHLEDIVGVRVVCLLRSDIAKIGEMVRSHFEVLSEDNKIDGAAVESFGYQSVHFVVRLSQECSGPRYAG